LFHLSSKFNITIDYLKKEYIKLCLEKIKIIEEKIKKELELKKKKSKKKRISSIIWSNKNISNESFSLKNNSFSKKSLIKISKDDIYSINIKKNLKLSQSNSIFSNYNKHNKEDNIKEKAIIENEHKANINEDKEFKSIAEGKLPLGTLVQQFLKQTDFESLEKQSRDLKYKLNNSCSNSKRKNKKKNTVIGNKIKNIKFTNLNEKQNIKNKELNYSLISSYFNKKLLLPKIFKINRKMDHRSLFLKGKLSFSTRNKPSLLMRNNSSKIYKKFLLTKADMFYQ
jgi:hypothetical protein